MRRVLTSLVVATASIVALFSTPAVASAESVMVLGLRSVEGDDDFASSLSGALRHSASQVPGWELNTREVSLSQMTLAHGCDDADVSCMEQIGNTLGVELMIYGTVRRTSTGDDYDFTINLYLFDSSQGAIRESLTDTIPRMQSDIDAMRPRVQRYIAELSGTGQTGSLRVQVNVEGAEIVVDGEPAGAVNAGVFSAEVAAGRHQVEIRADDHRTFRGAVTVVAGEEASLEVELEEGDEDDIVEIPIEGGEPEERSSGGLNWGAIASFGAAAVFAGLTVGSWVALDCLGEANLVNACGTDGDLQQWRTQVQEALPAGSMVDACDMDSVRSETGITDTAQGESACSARSTWIALQYVFLGLTAVSAGLGVYFLVAGDGDDEEDDPGGTEVVVTPGFGPTGGGVSASVTF